MANSLRGVAGPYLLSELPSEYTPSNSNGHGEEPPPTRSWIGPPAAFPGLSPNP